VRIARLCLTMTAWLTATAISAALVWFALRPVLDTASPDGTTLAAADLRDSPVASLGPSTAPITLPALSPSLSPSVSPALSPTASPTHVGSPTANAGPTGSAELVDGWTKTTASDGSVYYLRSFRVAGGVAVMRESPGVAQVVSATPAAGYSVQTSQPEASRAVVSFYQSNKQYIIDAIWFNDAPYAQVSTVT
jgi:hypothetical protein